MVGSPSDNPPQQGDSDLGWVGGHQWGPSWRDRPPPARPPPARPQGVLAGPGTPRDPKSHLFVTKWVAIQPFWTFLAVGIPGPESQLFVHPFWTHKCQKVYFLAGFRIYVAGRLSRAFPRGPRGPKGPTGAPRAPQGAPWAPPRGPKGPKGPPSDPTGPHIRYI